MSANKYQAPALIPAMHSTALATAWCLVSGGVEVHAVHQSWRDIGRFSHRIKHIDHTGTEKTADNLATWLYDEAKKIGGRPVILPVSDKQALDLAEHQDRLREVCRISTTAFADMQRIVSKEGLYQLGESAGVRVPPMVIEPTLEQVKAFCDQHRGPYLAKPYYNGIGACALKKKNEVFPDADAFIRHVRENGSAALVVQRLIQGGDGWVYDAYGYCREDGSIATLASHKRIRQAPPGFGATSYGEIPAAPVGHTEEALFDNTRKLLSKIRYHGIFGIEWLQERETGFLYLIDFNARPFSSISHLNDCGLNLPLLAHRELQGDPLTDIPMVPKLEHKFWIDPQRDMQTAMIMRSRNEITWREWLQDVGRARSFAGVDRRDTGPAVQQSLDLAESTLGYARRFIARSFAK